MQVKNLTVEELKTLIHDTVAEAIADPMYDPDKGLEFKESVKQRLELCRQHQEAGVPLVPFADVVQKLGIELE